jgi:transcription elongation factor Elf1
MGKRKSRSSKLAAQPKKAPKLDKVFTCPFCNHPESVKCCIDLKLGYAEASCLICDESYCTVPNNLTAPTDVYHEWIDECERANDDVRRCRR